MWRGRNLPARDPGLCHSEAGGGEGAVENHDIGSRPRNQRASLMLLTTGGGRAARVRQEPLGSTNRLIASEFAR